MNLKCPLCSGENFTVLPESLNCSSCAYHFRTKNLRHPYAIIEADRAKINAACADELPITLKSVWQVTEDEPPTEVAE